MKRVVLVVALLAVLFVAAAHGDEAAEGAAPEKPAEQQPAEPAKVAEQPAGEATTKAAEVKVVANKTVADKGPADANVTAVETKSNTAASAPVKEEVAAAEKVVKPSVNESASVKTDATPTNGTAKGLRGRRGPLRSIFQACRKEMRRLCAGNVHLGCLIEKKANVTDDRCMSWLDARAACLQDVKNTKCEMPFLQCLVKMPAKDLSQTCKESDFYSSTKQRVRRFVPRRPKQEAVEKPAQN